MKRGEDFLIRPVEQGFALALTAESVAVIGIFACEEEDEGDAGEEGEDDYNRDKCSHVFTPFSSGTVAGLFRLCVFRRLLGFDW